MKEFIIINHKNKRLGAYVVQSLPNPNIIDYIKSSDMQPKTLFRILANSAMYTVIYSECKDVIVFSNYIELPTSDVIEYTNVEFDIDYKLHGTSCYGI